MTRFLVLVALAILSVVASPVAAEMLFGSADYGIHTVKHRARPIQLFVWYPAEVESGAKPLEYGDYIRLSDITIVPWKQTAEEKQATVDAYVAGSQEPEKIQAILDVLLAMPTKAVKNAPAAEGKFPLLIVGSGGNTPAYIYATLCEYLASRGYVVVALPSIPKRAGERWPFSHLGLDLQMRDTAFAINMAVMWPNVDGDRLALLAWSVGGVSQALMQMQNSDVDALVSLDSGSGYLYGTQMMRESTFFDSTAMSVPYLHAHGLAPAHYEVEKDFTLYESWCMSKAWLLTFEHLSHADFRSHTVTERMLMDPEGSRMLVESFRFLSKIVLRFLDEHVKGEFTVESLVWPDHVKKETRN